MRLPRGLTASRESRCALSSFCGWLLALVDPRMVALANRSQAAFTVARACAKANSNHRTIIVSAKDQAADKLVLGIETSCDETAAAVVLRDCNGRGRILSNIVRSQWEHHRPFGGVVPEIAARAHVECLDELITDALKSAGITLARCRRDSRNCRARADRRPYCRPYHGEGTCVSAPRSLSWPSIISKPTR